MTFSLKIIFKKIKANSVLLLVKDIQLIMFYSFENGGIYICVGCDSKVK